MLVEAHRVLAILVALGAGLVVILVAFGESTHRPMRFARDRAILGVLVLVLAGAALGLVLLATGPGPEDPLHLLYAAVAALVLPVARFWEPLARRRSLAVAVSGAALALLVLRLFQTG